MKTQSTQFIFTALITCSLLLGGCSSAVKLTEETITEKMDETIDSTKAQLNEKKIELIKRGNEEIDTALDKVKERAKDEVNSAIDNKFDEIDESLTIPE
jgi:outer membrane murein-binding lipoprotein Lpp